MEPSPQVDATTQTALLPKVVDNVLTSTALLYRLVGNSKKWRGKKLERAIKYRKANIATSFAGLDTFTASQPDNKIRLSYDLRAVRAPIAISVMDTILNQAADSEVIDLIIENLEEAEQELVDLMGDIVYGLGTNNSNKDPLGLGALVDDATDVTTIGGQSRSTYPILKATRTASGGTLTQALVSTLYSAVSRGNGRNTPTLGISNETVWDLYESLLTPTIRTTYSDMGYLDLGLTGKATRPTEAMRAHTGFVAINIKGIPFVRDEKATAQNFFFINENWTEFYGAQAPASSGYKPISLGSTQIDGNEYSDSLSNYTGFNWSGWKNPTNQAGMVADFVQFGNCVTWKPNANGRLTGITTV